MRKAERNRGDAMVIVLCVMAVFLALSATILFSGSVALNTARNNLTFERGKVQAVSLADVIAEDMQLPLNGKGSYLAHYVRDAIMGDVSGVTRLERYDEAKSVAENLHDKCIRQFTLDEAGASESGGQHQIRIELYWTGDGKPDENNPKDDGSVDTQNIHLFIDVVSTINGSEYRVRNEFTLRSIQWNGTWNTSEADRESNYDPDKGAGKGNYKYLWDWNTVGRENT